MAMVQPKGAPDASWGMAATARERGVARTDRRQTEGRGGQPPSTEEAATTPRKRRSAASRAAVAVAGLQAVIGELAEQVDQLLDVAHEVAARDLLVGDDLGQVLPRRPGVGQADESRDQGGGCSGRPASSSARLSSAASRSISAQRCRSPGVGNQLAGSAAARAS